MGVGLNERRFTIQDMSSYLYMGLMSYKPRLQKKRYCLLSKVLFLLFTFFFGRCVCGHCGGFGPQCILGLLLECDHSNRKFIGREGGGVYW